MAPSKKLNNGQACRVCLSAKSGNRVSFNFDSEWSRLLDYCFGIIVTAESGLQVLCGKCSVSVKDFSALKTLALKNDTLWNNSYCKPVKIDIETHDVVDIKDEDESNHFQDVDYYLDVRLDTEQDGDKNSIEQFDTKDGLETDVTVDFDTLKIKKETETLEKVKKKRDKMKIDTNIPEDMSEVDFIKKYFKVQYNSEGKWKTKYECRYCSSCYMRRDRLPVHIQKCLSTVVPLCKNVKKNEEKCEKKMSKSGKNVGENALQAMYYCGLCEFSSPEEQEVNNHVKEHFVKNELNCQLCEYAGRDGADMTAHRYKHMPEDYNYKYQCPACNRQPKNLLTLMFHYRSDHLNKPGGWCQVCNKTFTGYKYYRNHERLHVTEKCYICDTCGCKFLFRNLIIRHMEEHMDIRNYVCDTCGKSFKRNNALTYHIRAFHMKNEPAPCHHCGKKFKNQYSLKMHMKMVGKGNNYICDVCSKGYPTLNLLKKHMFWHTGEKPFSCESCGARYKSKQILELHKRKHAGILPYKCEMCEKKFLSTYQLKVHMSVHTGVRRVKCLVCDKTFNEKKRMLEHCKSKHDSSQIKSDSQLVPLSIV